MKTIEVMIELVRAAVLDKTAVIPQNVSIDWDQLSDCLPSRKVATKYHPDSFINRYGSCGTSGILFFISWGCNNNLN